MPILSACVQPRITTPFVHGSASVSVSQTLHLTVLLRNSSSAPVRIPRHLSMLVHVFRDEGVGADTSAALHWKVATPSHAVSCSLPTDVLPPGALWSFALPPLDALDLGLCKVRVGLVYNAHQNDRDRVEGECCVAFSFACFSQPHVCSSLERGRSAMATSCALRGQVGRASSQVMHRCCRAI